MVSSQDQASESGAIGFCGGVVFDKDGALHPAKYLAALAAKVRAAGADILEGTPVLKLEESGGNYRLHTARGQTVATKVAICTNGYTGPQFPDFRRRVLPLRSAMIATEPLPPEVMARLMPKGRIYGDSRRIIAYYRPSPDGTRILFGSRATGFHDDPTGNAKHLHRSLVAIFPELARTKIDHVWSGLVAYSFDHAPHIGQMEGLHFAMGYCGSGVSRASYFGNKLGFKILGDQDKGRTSFDDLALPTKPFYTGNPWFMPAVLNWHRLADRLGF
ncbi:MAG: NAD(P)/FAD-dependent oxidoreductase, partial [Alphaproteobacteria bacterium]